MEKTKGKKGKSQDKSILFGSVTVGTKGQFVIPVEARRKLNINPGDHLLVFGSKDSKVLAVIKSKEVAKLLDDVTDIV